MTPERNLELQYCLAHLYGPRRKEVLAGFLADDGERFDIYSENAIKLAVKYNVEYSESEEIKELATKVAFKLGLNPIVVASQEELPTRVGLHS